MLEIHFQVQNIPKELQLINDERYFILNINCKIKNSDDNIFKNEIIYLFSDLIMWVTQNEGKFEGCYSFYDTCLEIQKSDDDLEFSIGVKNKAMQHDFRCADNGMWFNYNLQC